MGGNPGSGILGTSPHDTPLVRGQLPVLSRANLADKKSSLQEGEMKPIDCGAWATLL